jgi:hypothetical protein
VTSPAGGEIVVQLPGRLAHATVDNRPAAVSHNGNYVKVAVDPGERKVQIKWHPGKRASSG